MLEIDWKKVIKTENNDPNASFKNFELKLHSIIDTYMPLKKMSLNEMKYYCKPWVTPGIKNSIRRRDALHKKFIKSKDKEIKNGYHIRYKELKNHIVTLCRNSKKLYKKHNVHGNKT